MLSTAVRWLLVLPPLLPAAVLLVMLASYKIDMTLSERYESIGIDILLFVLLPIVVAVEILALRNALPILIKNPHARSAGNILCVAVGLSYLAFAIGVVIWYGVA